MSMLRQVLLRNALRRLSIHSKPPKLEVTNTYAAVAAQPVTVATRGIQTDNEAELREEKRRCFEGHCQSPITDVPNWSEKLASDSEAIVKSERHNSAHFEKMQRDTVEYLAQYSLREPTIKVGVAGAGYLGPREEIPLEGIPFFGVEEVQMADSKYE